MNRKAHIQLVNGPAVPLPVLQLAWRLEARGVTLRVADGALRAGPPALLSPADMALLRQYRRELLALVVYCEHAPARPM